MMLFGVIMFGSSGRFVLSDVRCSFFVRFGDMLNVVFVCFVCV